MSTTQKIIKNLALAFAFFLVVIIFSGMAFAFTLVGNFFFNTDNILENKKIIELSNNIENINIEVSTTDLSIIEGKEFKIETNGKNIKIKDNNKNLTIKEPKQTIFNTSNVPNTIIYIPKENKIKELSLSTGAGIVTIEDINSNNLDLELGAGKVDIDNITILEETTITGGTGQINLLSSELHNLKLELGVGELNLEASILGKSNIECGVGNSNINLIGTPENYKLSISKGIGNIKINNKSINDKTSYGDGNNKISLNGGIGNIDVDFKNKKENING